MIKLNAPNIKNDEVLEKCTNSIRASKYLHTKLKESKNDLLIIYQKYKHQAHNQNLFQFEKCNIGSLSHAELTSLYTNHFVPKQKPCREYYDLIINLTHICPYCGFGEVKDLDHYLPKSQYPFFSIYTDNLVPACAKCNTEGKGQSIAQTQDKQILHPYFDKACFFEDQWLFAKYEKSINGNYIRYYINPPESWDGIDCSRVKNHFSVFNLLKRFSQQANNKLAEVEKTMEGLMELISPNDVITKYLTPITEERHKNHWERVMFLSLIDYINNSINSSDI